MGLDISIVEISPHQLQQRKHHFIKTVAQSKSRRSLAPSIQIKARKMAPHQICTDIRHQHKLQILRRDLAGSYLIQSHFFRTTMDNHKTLKLLLIRTLENHQRQPKQSNRFIQIITHADKDLERTQKTSLLAPRSHREENFMCRSSQITIAKLKLPNRYKRSIVNIRAASTAFLPGF